MFFRNKPEKQSRIILDYVTVSYREILGVALVALLGLGAAYGVWHVYFRQPDPADLARTEIQAADRALRRASSVVTPDREDLDDVLGRARDDLTAAREYLRRGEHQLSMEHAASCQNLAMEVYREVQGETMHIAVLTDISGTVDYQRRNSPTWLPASNGLELQANDKVRTLSNSGARLRYPNGIVHTLDEKSVIHVLALGIDTRTGRSESGFLLQRGGSEVESPEGTVATIKTPEADVTAEGPTQLRATRDERSEQSEFMANTAMTVRTIDGEVIRTEPQIGTKVDREGQVEQFSWIRAPDLLSPSDGRVFLMGQLEGQSVELEWESVPNAASYRLQISRLNIFTGNVEVEQDITETRATLERLAFGSWWWRVISLSEDGRRSIAPAAWSFKIRRADQAGSDEGPSLELKNPLTIGRRVLLEGTTDPGTLLTYSLNAGPETSVSVEANGSFREFVTLNRPGLSEITLRAQSPAGAVTTEVLPVRYETY